MPDTPTTEPASFRAGDTVTWLKEVSDYPPASGWTLKYAFRNASTNKDVTCTTSGTRFLATILPAASSAYTVGRYDWIAYVTKGTGVNLEQHTIDQGSLAVLPNLAAAAPYDARSDARKIYDDLLAAYKDHVSNSHGHVEAYTIGGRSMKFRNTGDILDQLKYWAAQVRAEEDAEAAANGNATSRSVGARFSRI